MSTRLVKREVGWLLRKMMMSSPRRRFGLVCLLHNGSAFLMLDGQWNRGMCLGQGCQFGFQHYVVITSSRFMSMFVLVIWLLDFIRRQYYFSPVLVENVEFFFFCIKLCIWDDTSGCKLNITLFIDIASNFKFWNQIFFLCYGQIPL